LEEKREKERENELQSAEGRADRKLVGGNSKLFAYHAGLSRIIIIIIICSEAKLKRDAFLAANTKCKNEND